MPNVSEFQIGLDGKAYVEKDDGTNVVQDLTKITSDIESIFRASARAGKFNNSIDNLPWVKPATWVASTVYYQGQVVVGLDGVNTYICQTGGTSAGSGGPTGSGYAPITDGGVTWWWYNKVRGELPSSTVVVSSGLLSTLLTNLPNYRTLSPTVSNPVVSWLGGVVEANPNGGGMVDTRGPNNSLPTSDPTGANAAFNTAVSGKIAFLTDSRKIVLGSINAIYTNTSITVEINGRRVSDSCFTVTTFQNPGGIMIDTTSLDLPPGLFTVVIRSNAGFSIVANKIYIESGATILPVKTNLKVAVEGDSLTQGGNNTPYHPGKDWVSQCFERLQIMNACNMAVGSTGFISDNGGAKTTTLQRLPRFASLNADIYIIAGNHNDDSYTSQQRQTAVLNYLKELRRLQPTSMIIVFGNTPLRDDGQTVGTPQYIAEQDLKAAFDLFNDPNSKFVPILTSPSGSWVSGTGNASSPANNGNKDRFYTAGDGHPNQRGTDYFAIKYQEELMNLFDSI